MNLIIRRPRPYSQGRGGATRAAVCLDPSHVPFGPKRCAMLYLGQGFKPPVCQPSKLPKRSAGSSHKVLATACRLPRLCPRHSGHSIVFSGSSSLPLPAECHLPRLCQPYSACQPPKLPKRYVAAPSSHEAQATACRLQHL